MSASESIKHCFVDLGSAKKCGSSKIGVWVSLKKRFVVFPDLEKSLFSTLFVDYEQMDETDPFTSFSEVCCCGCSNFRLCIPFI